MRRSQSKPFYHRLMKKGKHARTRKKSLKQGLDGCEIEKLLSISSSGRTYQWKRQCGKMHYACQKN
jgi:hypothetical protein